MKNDEQLHRIPAHKTKRRCPGCQINKWLWLGAVPISPEELEQHLLVRYRCERCGMEFLVEEAQGAKFVTSTERCIHCHSPMVEKISRSDADIELWQCRRCNGYMGVHSNDGSEDRVERVGQ